MMLVSFTMLAVILVGMLPAKLLGVRPGILPAREILYARAARFSTHPTRGM